MRHDSAIVQRKKTVSLTRVLEGFVDITMTWWVPVAELSLGVAWNGGESLLEDARVATLIEGVDVDVSVRLVLLDLNGEV